MHLLLLISVILVVISSFLLSVYAENKKFYINSCYFWGILFAQVVFGFETLSVPKILTPLNFLIFNVIVMIFSAAIFMKKSPQILIFEDLKDDITKIKSVILKDKWLKILFVAFCIFLIGTFSFVIFMPVYDLDAFAYHLARVPFWVINHSVNHFLITDIRALIMPINSEIIYAWAFLFIKSDIFVRIFSFCAYILFVVGLRGLFKELKLSVRTFLWTLFAVTSMPSVLFSVSGTESNTAVAALILSAVYLFLYAVKRNKITPIYFSSLLYALAIGTKTTAVISSFTVLLIASVIAFLYKRKDFYKSVLLCGAFLIFNFLIFAGYNYFLNCVEFGNPLTSVHARETHAFYGGFKAFIANIIRYIFDMFDFSQLPYSTKIWRIENAFSKIAIALLGIDPECGVLMDANKILKSGHDFENVIGMGIFGFALFIPSLYFSLKSFKSHSLRTKIISVFALGFIVNFFILSVTMGYMVYSIRFLAFFTLIACPSLVYVIHFKKFKIAKYLSGLLIIYTFTFFYYFYQYRFTPYLMHLFFKHPGIQNFKNHIRNTNINWTDITQSAQIVDFLNNENNLVNVLFFVSNGSNIYTIVTGQEKYKADFMSLETAEENNIDWNKYDYIFVTGVQLTSFVKNINKFQSLAKTISDGINIEFEYSPELFANCYYINRRDEIFDWVNSDDKRITKAACYHKKANFQKHNFELIKYFDAYDKNVNGRIYVYKKIK